MYALSPGKADRSSEATISVVDMRSKKLIQHAKLGATWVHAEAMGMAALL